MTGKVLVGRMAEARGCPERVKPGATAGLERGEGRRKKRYSQGKAANRLSLPDGAIFSRFIYLRSRQLLDRRQGTVSGFIPEQSIHIL